MGNIQQKPTQNQENPQQEEDGLGVTCEICIEPISLPNKKFKNQKKCAHPFCQTCISKYIEVKVDDSMSKIKCPALNCEHYFDPISCKPIVAHQLFDKWCDLLCDAAVLGFDRCYCPNRDCSELIVNECGGRVKKSKCPKCNKLFCFSCKIAWHAGYRCEESRELRDTNDVAFGVLAERKNWKRCPICHHYVELVSGCSFVKCRCGTSFCYRCGRNVNRNLCRCHRFIVNCNMCCGVLLILLFFVVLSFFFFINVPPSLALEYGMRKDILTLALWRKHDISSFNFLCIGNLRDFWLC